MKVTNHGFKGRQLQKEGCRQKAAAKQQGYAGVPIHVRTAEHNNIIADLPADGLLKRILSRDSMNAAYRKLKSNKGAGGIDRMSVDELLPYLSEHRLDLLKEIVAGKYTPEPVGLQGRNTEGRERRTTRRTTQSFTCECHAE